MNQQQKSLNERHKSEYFFGITFVVNLSLFILICY